MTVRVPNLQSPRRLDRVLKESLPALSRNGLFAALRRGRVRVDGARVREAGHLLSGGEEVIVEEERRSQASTADKGRKGRLPLAILHEDDALLVLDKPADLSVQPGKRTGFTLVDALKGYGRERGFEPYLVHRLDRGTTGVLVVAKSKEVAGLLGRAFKEGRRVPRERDGGASEVKKWYITLVSGEAPASGRITEALDGLPAESLFKLSDRYLWNGHPLSLLRVQILTGRKHQIRRHLAAAGYPVVGDELYGDFELNRLLRKERHAKGLFLHAAGIEIAHPITGVRLRFEADLPKEFKRVIQALYSSPASG